MLAGKFVNVFACVFVSVGDCVNVPECKEYVNVCVQSALSDHTDKCVRVTLCVAGRESPLKIGLSLREPMPTEQLLQLPLAEGGVSPAPPPAIPLLRPPALKGSPSLAQSALLPSKGSLSPFLQAAFYDQKGGPNISEAPTVPPLDK